MKRNIKNTEDLKVEAENHVHELKSFYTRLVNYVVFCAIMIFINLKFTPNFYWFWFPVLGWGIGVLSHAIRTFSVPIFGKKWEERKKEEYINKNL